MKELNKTIISIEGLTKKFGSIQALDGLNMEVLQGDIYGFLGPNGSGKSTTIRILTSLVKYDTGKVKVFGMDIKNKRTEILSQLGALIERPNFYEHLTASVNLAILSKYSGLKKDHGSILKTLELVGLAGRENDKVGSYSEGMKQRLGIAQAIIHKPKLLILDEPFNSLDPQGVKDVRELIVRLNKEHGVTVLISSHKLDEIEKLTNKIVFISNGKAVASGKLDELLSHGLSKLSIICDNPEKVEALLLEAGIEVAGIERSVDKLTVSCYRNQIPEINSLLNKHNVKVYGLIPDYSLESIFLSYTKTA